MKNSIIHRLLVNIRHYNSTLQVLSSGLLGLKVLGKIQKASDYCSSSFLRSNSASDSVLIVGTGPSVDSINITRLSSGYQSVILVNHAIRFVDQIEHSKCCFLTADLIRANQIVREEKDRLQLLGSRKSFVIVTSPVGLSKVMRYKSKFLLLRLSSYKLLFLGPKWLSIFRPIMFNPALFPKVPSSSRHQLIANYLCEWLQSIRSVDYPHISISSAFDAIVLALALGFKHIDLIGCDFTSSRSSALSPQLGNPPPNAFPMARECLKTISEKLRVHSVFINNLSY